MWPQRRQPTRLPRPWDSPGKNTGVGCHFLLQCRKVKSEREVAQSCPTPRDLMDWSLPGSSVHGIFQARVLEWGAIAFSAQECYHSFIHNKLGTAQMSFNSWMTKQTVIHPYHTRPLSTAWRNPQSMVKGFVFWLRRHPGCDIVLQFCRMFSSEETVKRQGISLYDFYYYMGIYTMPR